MLSLEGYYLSHTHAHTPFSVACNRWFYSHNACCIFKNNNNIKSLLLAATLMKRPIIRGALCFCSLFCWTLVSNKDLNQPKQSLSCRSCLALLTRKKKKKFLPLLAKLLPTCVTAKWKRTGLTGAHKSLRIRHKRGE